MGAGQPHIVGGVSRLNLVDLFSGCGGMTRGFEDSGAFRSVFAVEFDRDAAATYAANFGDHVACGRIEDAVVSTTDPRQFVTDDEKRALAIVSADARLLRYGGDCYCYTQLAMGLADVVIENGLLPYDIQALIPIIEAAGGVVTDWAGGPCDQGGAVLACGDPALHKALVKRLKG